MQRLTRALQGWVEPSALARRVDPYRRRRGLRAFGMRQVEIIVHTARVIWTEEIGRRAAGLTYYTVLSLVPVLAVAFALFDAFGGLSSMREPLKRLVVGWLAAGRSEEVGAWLDRFIANINAGAIAGFGVIILFYSAVGLLTNVESAFNRIWGIERNRPLHVRFVIYWCVITLAPPLVGVSISLSAQLQSSSFAAAVLAWLPFGLGRVLVSLGSALAVSVAFVVTYKIVPNTKVELRCAVLGGLIASLLWNGSKALFIAATAGSVKYSAIYGALSTLPLLMIWLYLSWNIVLFGVSYTTTYQTMVGARLEDEHPLSPALRERLAARLLVEIARRFRAGERAPTADELIEVCEVGSSAVRSVLASLVKSGIVLETVADNDGDGGGHAPARDLQSTSLAELSEALHHEHTRAPEADGPTLPADADQRRIDELLARAHAAAHAVLASIDLRTLAAAPTPSQLADDAQAARGSADAS
jgi:membrane protein